MRLTKDQHSVQALAAHGANQAFREVTRHPTAEWLAQQITEAFPWTSGGHLNAMLSW